MADEKEDENIVYCTECGVEVLGNHCDDCQMFVASLMDDLDGTDDLFTHLLGG
jgi:hypothetical protein